MTSQIPPQKSVVTIVEMARLVGLSRTRFRQLVAVGVFPSPKRNAETGRPYFDADGQAACLSVRAKNCGINGQPVLFYSRRMVPQPSPAARRPLSAQSGKPRQRKTTAPPASGRGEVAVLVDGLRQLGLSDVNEQKVADALRVCFPGGTEGKPSNEVLLAVFRRLMRRDSGGNEGR